MEQHGCCAVLLRLPGSLISDTNQRVPFSHPRAKLSRNVSLRSGWPDQACLSSARSRTQRCRLARAASPHTTAHATRRLCPASCARLLADVFKLAHVARPGHEKLSHVSRPLPSAAQHRLSRPHDGQPLTLAWQNCRNAAGVRHQRCVLASVVVTTANARGDSHGAR